MINQYWHCLVVGHHRIVAWSSFRSTHLSVHMCPRIDTSRDCLYEYCKHQSGRREQISLYMVFSSLLTTLQSLRRHCSQSFCVLSATLSSYCITRPVPCPAFFQDMCILPKRHDECWTLSFSLAVHLSLLHAFSRALEPYYNRISYNITCPSVFAFRKEEREGG